MTPIDRPDADDTSRKDLEERAYRLWEEEGRPEGRAGDHWKKAEEEARQPAAAPLREALDDDKTLDDKSGAVAPPETAANGSGVPEADGIANTEAGARTPIKRAASRRRKA